MRKPIISGNIKPKTRRKFKYIYRLKNSYYVYGSNEIFGKEDICILYEIYHSEAINGCKEEDFAYTCVKVTFEEIEDWWYAPIFSNYFIQDLRIKPPQPKASEYHEKQM